MNVTRLRAADGIPGDLPTLVAAFLEHIRLRGKARNTLLAYSSDLCRVVAYLARFDITLVQLVSERLLNRWLDDGLGHHGWSRRTAARRLMAVRAFLRWCKGEGYADHDASAHVKIRFRTKAVIAPELEPLKGVIAAIGQTDPIDLRDRAVLILLLDAALRAGEAVVMDAPGQGSKVYTVSLERQQVLVRPKGGDDDESETIGIEEQTVAALRAWLRVRAKVAKADEPALFVNKTGRRLSRQSLYLMVRDRGAAAGITGLHPHLFRHRRVGDVVEKLGISTGQALARHKQASTTVNVYGAHAAEVHRNAIRSLAPLGEISP